MNEIRIDNLTKYQVQLLDEIWECETEEEYLDWHSSLSEKDKDIADVLMRLVLLEMSEEFLIDGCSDAKKLLAQFSLKGNPPTV
jgi:hypothetical protein